MELPTFQNMQSIFTPQICIYLWVWLSGELTNLSHCKILKADIKITTTHNLIFFFQMVDIFPSVAHNIVRKT